MSEAEDTLSVLHGRLHVRVVEARDLDGHAHTLFSRFQSALTGSVDEIDPYCSIKLGYVKLLHTPFAHNTVSPSWEASAVFDVCHEAYALEFRVKSAKRPGVLGFFSTVKLLSMFSIPMSDLKEQRHFEGWFPLGPYARRPMPEELADSSDDEAEAVSEDDESFGEICIDVHFTPIDELDDLGAASVSHTYFPSREGVHVRMYQNAEVTPGQLPEIPFHSEFSHGRCWSELARAIMESTELIYITGWALWPELVMVRTEHDGDEWTGKTLGEMLLQKAEEGVTVCVLVWDEVASGPWYEGLMGTHDEEVIDYFSETKVFAAKVPRQNEKEGPLVHLSDALLFTHHQKTVIVSRSDPDYDGRHRIEAWVGGLDLTDGRYDTPQHSLFRTLDGVHAAENFWNACAPDVGAESGPREPWHDIHAVVTGRAAWDVLANFEGRWCRQAPEEMQGELRSHEEDVFVQGEEEDSIQDGSWTVQVLRSINGSSTLLDTDHAGLVMRKMTATDQSIHAAYVHHIRSARRFVFIENQYFLGSSHMWDCEQRGSFAANLVPIELAEKICAKIRAGELFRVYVVVPLYPEGPPASVAVQEILSHQRRTVEMITTRIANAIRETGSDTTIGDWFNIFCLVNRESEEGGKGNGGTNEVEEVLSSSRRFMVYVHSKFAVFDDSVAIIGSANINSRSMDGGRDTEIAIAAWQPEHTAAGPMGYGEQGGEEEEGEVTVPQGDVAAFRAGLWAAHVGEYMDELADPGSDECVQKLQEVGLANWEHFISDEDDAVADMPFGQLARYPYEFDEDGNVSTTQELFPDFPDALIKGTATSGVPNILTG